jgi:hypothetical protein
MTLLTKPPASVNFIRCGGRPSEMNKLFLYSAPEESSAGRRHS